MTRAKVSEAERTEQKRQELIAEYTRLRDAGLNAERRAVLLSELQAFELGWPMEQTARR